MTSPPNLPKSSSPRCDVCRCGPDSTVRKLLRCICGCHEGPPLRTEQVERVVAVLGNGRSVRALAEGFARPDRYTNRSDYIGRVWRPHGT